MHLPPAAVVLSASAALVLDDPAASLEVVVEEPAAAEAPEPEPTPTQPTPTHAPAPAEQPESATPAASAEAMHAAASLLGAPPDDDLDLDLDTFLHDLGVNELQPAIVDTSANMQDTPASAAAVAVARQTESPTGHGGREGGRDCGKAQQDRRAAAGRPDRERDARARGGPGGVAPSECRRAQADTAGAGHAARRRVIDPGARDVPRQTRGAPSTVEPPSGCQRGGARGEARRWC
jgi:hypothetical protein